MVSAAKTGKKVPVRQLILYGLRIEHSLIKGSGSEHSLVNGVDIKHQMREFFCTPNGPIKEFIRGHNFVKDISR
mgnify:CR=1 FL=1|tara:strand:- start:13 stop:234 length:222 start_codon:yes stop_codon:yes gene_type:complete